MNMIFSFAIEVLVTLAISIFLIRYLRPFLRRILTDLCGTEDRAQFWVAFTNLLLIGLPMIFALTYRPEATDATDLFFEVAGTLSWNLGGLLLALIGTGAVLSFFALFAPRSKTIEAK